MINISRYERQKIAWRIKALCNGCPEFITYYDIKDSLSEPNKISTYFLDKKNKDFLFHNKDISEDLKNILTSMSSEMDMYDRRRIALIHGMIQFPIVNANQIINKNDFINELNQITHSEERHELQYIFINSVINSLAEDENKILARKNIKTISDLKENGYEEDSLFAQFMKLNSLSTLVTKIPDNVNYVAKGRSQIPSKEVALKLLLTFNSKDFQDIAWVGGYKKFGKTYQMSLKKRKIIDALKELNNLSFTDSLKFFS
jgi:UDP-2,3-diacylglucosamine pyrophosphatase LpxH